MSDLITKPTITVEAKVIEQRIYEDLEFHVVMTGKKSIVDYEVRSLIIYDDSNGNPLKFDKGIGEATTDMNEAEILIKGTIRFDGCSHNNFGAGGYIHGCGRFEMVRLGILFDRMFDWAGELMPECKSYLT